MRSLGIVVFGLIVGCGGGDDAEPTPDAGLHVDAPATADRVVYVVRHAETGSTATDPPLDATGTARAMRLATRLAGANVSKVYASQYHRTRDTGMPVAAAAGITIDVRMVDASSSATYGMELATAARDAMVPAVLIVGHSNTVPETVKALSGVTVPAIAETEYDRLYTITLSADGPHLVSGTY
ncbi:phosphoglycerate mutase family protein [soil metagenome]